MRVRHYVLFLLVVLAMAGVLVGCDILGFVSIDQRVADFQVSLNAADRSSLYTNFHPDQTADYAALKDPPKTIDAVMPPLASGDTAYTLAVTDESDAATGVIVKVTGGPALYGAPKNLKLVMATTGTGDYRIVSLAQDNNDSVYTVYFK
jgi:hypothetical protein